MLDLDTIFDPDRPHIGSRRGPKSMTQSDAAVSAETAEQVKRPPDAWQPAWLDLDWIERIGPDRRRTLIHPDHADDEWEVMQWPDACATCGERELWQTLAGTWCCRQCDPPTVAERVRDEAARLRQSNPPQKAKSNDAT